jgi:hypothetical protein
MRGLAVLTVLLLSVALLAGCSDAPQGPATDSGSATGGGDGGRVARSGRGSVGEDDTVNETELRSVEILHTPLQMAGPGPASFDVVVPPEVASVAFLFTGGPGFDSAGLRIELSGCGAYDQGIGFSGTTGGGSGGELCGAADAGPQTVSVSGTLVVFDGQFIVTAFVPTNATAEPTT